MAIVQASSFTFFLALTAFCLASFLTLHASTVIHPSFIVSNTTHISNVGRADALAVAWQTRTDVRQMRVFVVTYKKHSAALQLVHTLLESDLPSMTFEITIICNWGTFVFPPEPPFSTHVGSLSVISNAIRSSASWGHLAREWNAALLHGFGSLRAPQSDVVVMMHGDAVLPPGMPWASEIYDEHMQLNGSLFLQMGRGDMFMSTTAEGVRVIGTWDEHFCDVGAQEADYMLRAVKHGFDRVRINDVQHQRFHRPWYRNLFRDWSDDWGTRDRHPSDGKTNYHAISSNYFGVKWPRVPKGGGAWGTDTSWLKTVEPAVRMQYLYPFFERYIEDPVAKGYQLDPHNLPDFPQA